MQLQSAQVVENRLLAPAYYLLKVRLPAPLADEVVPGAFVMVRGPWGYDPLLPRPFSLLDCDEASGELSVLYKTVGRGTRLLSELREGDAVSVLGPMGQGFPLPGLDASRGAVLMAGGGFGVAPFYHAAKKLRKAQVPFHVYFGGRSATDLPWSEELGDAAGGEVTLTTNDGTRGEKGFLTEPLRRRLAQGGVQQVWACGPQPMLHAVHRLAGESGVPAFVSLEEHMGCGIGVCLGCVTRLDRGAGPKYERICLEGPVFDSAQVVWP